MPSEGSRLVVEMYSAWFAVSVKLPYSCQVTWAEDVLVRSIAGLTNQSFDASAPS